MVTVGDVERMHGVESRGQTGLGIAVANGPERVPNAVQPGVGVRCARRGGGNEGVDFGRGRVDQQHRTGLGVERVDLAHAVVFLVRTGEFVFADAVGVVIGHARGGDQPGLAVLAHDDAVGVVSCRGVARQHAGVNHRLQVFGGLGVDRGRIRVGTWRQVDLRFGNVQKTPRAARGACPCLLGGQHVVGRSDDIVGASGGGTEGGEGLDQVHAVVRVRQRVEGDRPGRRERR